MGRSAENRVIEFIQLGQGDRNVLLIAALAGNDLLGVELAQRLAAHVGRFPNWLAGIKLTIVRDANPDGRLRRTAANAHGVELDRNFHTLRWRKVAENDRWISGRAPETEPETRLLTDLFADLKPQRVVVVGSSQRLPTLDFCGPAEGLARDVGIVLHCAPKTLDPAAAPGSLAVYAGHDRGAATLVLRLPAGRGAEEAFRDYKRALLAAVSVTSNDAAAAPPVAAPTPATETAALGETSDRNSQPKVLTYDELANGAALVPVIGRREAALPAAPAPVPSVAATPIGASSDAVVIGDGAAARRESMPATLPVSSHSPPPQPSASARDAEEGPPVTPVRLERLPPVDRSRPPVQWRRQEPIPFYPDTGK